MNALRHHFHCSQRTSGYVYRYLLVSLLLPCYTSVSTHNHTATTVIICLHLHDHQRITGLHLQKPKPKPSPQRHCHRNHSHINLYIGHHIRFSQPTTYDIATYIVTCHPFAVPISVQHNACTSFSLIYTTHKPRHSSKKGEEGGSSHVELRNTLFNPGTRATDNHSLGQR